MTTLSILTGPEFCVLLLLAAAAAIVAIVRPRRGGAIQEHLLGGNLVIGGADEFPRVELQVTATEQVVLRRSGWHGVDPRAVSAKVEIKGFDITVTERVTPGGNEEVDCAEFLLPQLAPQERYHLQYVAESISRTVAFYFRVTPGMTLIRTLE